MKLKMKILALVLMISTIAFGQKQERNRGNLSPEERAQRRSETLKAKLQLTDEQTTKVYNELLANEKAMQQQREEMKKARQKHDEAMKNILTPAQYEQLKSMQEQRREMMKNRRNQGDGDDSTDDGNAPPPPAQK
jgi:predicted  nucleic acid-binding Zn-ribbon protein